MNIHPHMVTALYLRQYPMDKIVHDDGKEFWYCPKTDKYLWRNPRSEKRRGIYEARGLKEWWLQYLRECEKIEFEEEGELPF